MFNRDYQASVAQFRIADSIALEIEEFELAAKYSSELGRILLLAEDYNSGFEFLLKSYEYMQKVGIENIPKAGALLSNIGWGYWKVENYEKAKFFLLESSRFANGEYLTEVNNFNTLGLCYLEEDADSALFFFRRAMDVATRNSDTMRIGVIAHNIAQSYLEKGDTSEAMPYFSKAADFSRRERGWPTAVSAAFQLAEAEIRLGDFILAKDRIDRTHRVMDSLNLRNPEIMILYYEALKKYYFATKDFKEAYIYLDSLMLTKSVADKARNIAELSNKAIRLETERYLTELELSKSEEKRQRQLRNGVVIIAALILLIAATLFNQHRLRTLKDREILQLQKKQAEDELLTSQQKLERSLSRIQRKNEQIKLLKERASKERDEINDAEKQIINQKLQEYTILTDKDWADFKKEFGAAHSMFIPNLLKNFPKLTEAELRLLCLFRLQLSRVEIANMLGISPESVRKSAFRIRKKLGLESKQDLLSFVYSV